jgi:lysophospholipase L1-like esterase
MKNIITTCICLFVELIVSFSFAQKKIAILGSSTAAGTGASVPDSSWVGRLQKSFRINNSDGLDTVIDNRAVGGYVTYKSMPTGFTPPPNRPTPDPLANVTYVLDNIHADIVIINYPTNDIVSDYDPKEMMNNLRLMFDQFNSNGIICYISTSQPRNTTDAQRVILRQVVDSVQNAFGYYAINFWDDLVTNDGLNMLRPDMTPDGIHPNDLGHRLLFQRVQAKNIFAAIGGAPLPLILSNWQVQFENKIVKLNWSTDNEESNTLFQIQRSDNGKDFQTLYKINGIGRKADYLWTDQTPLTGKSFYRLQITEPNHINYSRVIQIVNDQKRLISSLFTDGSKLQFQLNSNSNETGTISIFAYSGAIIKKQSFHTTNNSLISIPIIELAPGSYILQITTVTGLTTVERFAKMK